MQTNPECMNSEVYVKMTLSHQKQSDGYQFRPPETQHNPADDGSEDLPKRDYEQKRKEHRPCQRPAALEFGEINLKPHPEEEERVEKQAQEVVDLAYRPFRYSPLRRQEEPRHERAEERAETEPGRAAADDGHESHGEHKVRAFECFPFGVLVVHPLEEDRRDQRRHYRLQHERRAHRHHVLDRLLVVRNQHQGEECQAEDNHGYHVGVDSGHDGELPDVGFSDLEVGYESCQNVRAGAGESEGEGDGEGHHACIVVTMYPWD
ncbi:hypothetical protein V6N11_025028 [Hibiscus sabdariffa]|uniref:Uncharacterized protein n=1 Tax=Hibiscus sabdariffa TaxID=183260 RepID=A0ABR2QNZ6_9ROSI